MEQEKTLKNLKNTVIAAFIADMILTVAGLIRGDHYYWVEGAVYFLAGLSIAIVHGIPMYGKKKIILITIWGSLCSMFFECCGCNFGWFFSKYIYTANIPGPKVFGFPLLVIICYGCATYVLWATVMAALGKFKHEFTKVDIFIVAAFCSLLFVSIDLITDPLSSTMQGLWVWDEHGCYYGIPFQNYLGWYLMSYVEYVVCGLILYHNPQENKLPEAAGKKAFWYAPVLIYGLWYPQVFFYLFMGRNHEVATRVTGQSFWTTDIYQGMFIVSTGCILVPTLITLYRLAHDSQLK